jgi:hypothetical protein
VLKRISGKPRAVQLKSNVFNPLPSERSCHIKWEANGSAAEADWSPDSPPIDALKGIDIFDTDEAQHYLTQESAATYIPRVVGIFEKLAQYLKLVRDKLGDEQSQLVSKLPGLPAVYQRCRIVTTYGALSTATTENIAVMTNWSEADEQALRALNERLSVQDPAESAAAGLRFKHLLIRLSLNLCKQHRLLAKRISTVSGRYVLMQPTSAELRLTVNR